MVFFFFVFYAFIKSIWAILIILTVISSYIFYRDPGESFDNYENAILSFEIIMIIVISKKTYLFILFSWLYWNTAFLLLESM